MPPELELVRQWLDRARIDLHTVDAELASGSPEPVSIGFHCQQAVEKSLKAYLTHHQIEFAWSHVIKYLADLCAEHDTDFQQFVAVASPLTDYAVRMRYPFPEPDPTLETVQAAIDVAREVYAFVLSRLPDEARPSA